MYILRLDYKYHEMYYKIVKTFNLIGLIEVIMVLDYM
jgi:hypothetical protein